MAEAFRNRQLRLAIGTSVISKLSGALVQLAILPLALASLGQDRFAAFLALTSLAAWMGPLGLGLLPALTRELSAASAADDIARQKSMFAAAFWFTLLVGLLALVATAAVAAVWDPRGSLGLSGDIEAAEAQLSLFAAIGVVAVHFFATLSQAVRAGYQEGYVSNLLSAIGNVLTFLAVYALASGEPHIAMFILAAYAPMTLVLLLDFAVIIKGRPFLWPPHTKNAQAETLRSLLGTSLVTWAGQLHYFLTAFASIVIVSRYFSSADTVAFGALMRVTMLGYGVIALLVWPIVPALTDAVHLGDSAWARRTCSQMAVIVPSAGVAGGAIIAFLGPTLLPWWMGSDLEIPPLMAVGFGLYFLVWNCNFAAFNINLALGNSAPLAWTFLGEVLLVYLLAYLLALNLGASAMAIALGIGGLAVNFWWLPLRARRQLDKMKGQMGGGRS